MFSAGGDRRSRTLNHSVNMWRSGRFRAGGGGLGLELQSSSPRSRAGAPPAVRNEEIIRLMQM